MSKALMISMKPENAENILNGKKTLDLRTWIPKGYVGWVYVYVCKTIRNYKMSYYYQPKNQENIYRLHGNIPFRFWFDEYDVIEYVEGHYEVNPHDIPLKLCLDIKQINDYGKGKTLYAWHIKKLEVFDTPKELSEFESRTPYKNKDRRIVAWGHRPIIKPPQKMQWVYVKELEKIPMPQISLFDYYKNTKKEKENE